MAVRVVRLTDCFNAVPNTIDLQAFEAANFLVFNS